MLQDAGALLGLASVTASPGPADSEARGFSDPQDAPAWEKDSVRGLHLVTKSPHVKLCGENRGRSPLGEEEPQKERVAHTAFHRGERTRGSA